MNEQNISDREERIITGLAEIKEEMRAINRQFVLLNGSVTKHFRDDQAWQALHDLKEAARDLHEAKQAGFRSGVLYPLVVASALLGGGVGTVIGRTLGG